MPRGRRHLLDSRAEVDIREFDIRKLGIRTHGEGVAVASLVAVSS
jgi:hypothetical protein